MRTARLTALAAAILLIFTTAASHAAAADPKADDVPLTRAVLYTSGVGYFEHRGPVQGPTTLHLTFRSDQINDVLKSMVLIDPTGAGASVSYPSQEPVAHALASFGVDLSGNPSLPDLLGQLRGAAVVVRAPDAITGKILSVESQTRIVGQPPAKITDHTLTLVTDSGIRSIEFASIHSVTLTDEHLQQELNRALALLAESREKDRKPVEVRFTGQGPREVRVGYLAEAPVWKSSYRLDLSGDHPLLQGWAIVENTSDEDWKNVTLTLVSGRPISFVEDLYTPLFLKRPVVKPELFASLTPRVYEEGLDTSRSERQLAQEMDRRKDMAGAPATPAPAYFMAQSSAGHAEKKLVGGRMADAVSLRHGVAAMASGSAMAELFEFTLEKPIDLPRRRSAMLPILSSKIDAEKVSIYNHSQLADHPLLGAQLTNDTGMKLLAGPVTVFDAGSYAGDAQIGNLTQGDRRLISYAVDLAVTVDPSESTTQQLTAVKILRGVMRVTHQRTWTQKYAIHNKADAKRTLVIEQPFVNGRQLVTPAKPAEKTPEYYRFRVPIDAKTTGSFEVVEQEPITQTTAIIDAPVDTILFYVRQDHVSDKVKDALSKAAAMKQTLASLESKERDLQRQITEIQSGQERLRRNISTVGHASELGQRYVAKLSTQEDQLEKLDSQRADVHQKVLQQRDQLTGYLAALTVE